MLELEITAAIIVTLQQIELNGIQYKLLMQWARIPVDNVIASRGLIMILNM